MRESDGTYEYATARDGGPTTGGNHDGENCDRDAQAGTGCLRGMVLKTDSIASNAPPYVPVPRIEAFGHG